MMLRRLAFVSGLAVLSAVSLAPKAGAQTVDVPFDGDIQSICSFSTNSAGVLAVNPVVDDSIEASAGITGGGIGTAASVDVTCTLGGKLDIGNPSQMLGAPLVGATTQAVVENQLTNEIKSSSNTFGGGFWTTVTAGQMNIPSGSIPQELRVGMVDGNAGVAGTVPPGTYQYSVTLTAIPN